MDFNENRFLFRPKHFSGTTTPGVTTDIDYKVTSPHQRMAGIELIFDNTVDGDSVGFSVVDKDGVYAPAGTTLSSYTTNWFLDPSTKRLDVQPGYLSEVLPVGVYIRVSYNSTGSIPVHVRANLMIHEVKQA